jgi:holo-[acyl-carrier protein] synthase
VERRPGGAPALLVTGRAAELASALGVGHWHVSITHTETTASAIVVAVS